MSEKNLKILYITQTIDKGNYILYPFYKWINLIARQVNKISAVCLNEGRHEDLAANIQVISMGKEKGEGRRGYLRNFYKSVLPLFKNKEVDVVFVHMVEIFVFLIWPLAWWYKKPIVWWKAHGHLSFKAKLAAKLVTKIITSSETGFPINTLKKQIIGQGIDTEYFSLKLDYPAEVQNVVWTGRISPIKNIETLIQAADLLVNKQGKHLVFKIIGSVPLKKQEPYLESLKQQVKDLNLQENVLFLGAVPHEEIKKYYQEADIYVNTSNTGSLDKTVLEAMACGTMVVNSNYGFKEIFKDFPVCQFEQSNYNELADKIKEVMGYSAEERQSLGAKLREIVVREHNMVNLINKIVEVFNQVI